jgi:pimeloyl-ACP methyl ester carboxylesterase
MAGISDWKETVASIGVPTLLIRGGNRERGAIVTDEVAAEAQRLNRKVESVCFAQAGHNIRREAFAPYVAAVTAFLARHTR